MMLISDSLISTTGNAQLELNPSFTAVTVGSGSPSESNNGVYKLHGKAMYDTKNNRILIQGECEKSIESTSQATCLLGEAFDDYALSDNLSVKVGKSTFDVSATPILTSPMNPSTSGLSSLSPLLPQEGIWSASFSAVPNQVWSFQFGAATEFESATPFGVVKSHLGKFDLGITGTPYFGGLGGSAQLTDSVLLYSEGNSKEDLLAGSQWTTNLLEKEATRFSGEYFFNSNGIGSGSPHERFSKVNAERNMTHQQVYQFPSPKSMDNSAWGPMSFMSQNLLLVDVRNLSGRVVPSITWIESLDDQSWMSISGLEFHFPDLKPEWRTLLVRVEWRHFEGNPEVQEFGAVAKAIGGNQWWVSVQI